jgi:hypothetical protein
MILGGPSDRNRSLQLQHPNPLIPANSSSSLGFGTFMTKTGKKHAGPSFLGVLRQDNQKTYPMKRPYVSECAVILPSGSTSSLTSFKSVKVYQASAPSGILS